MILGLAAVSLWLGPQAVRGQTGEDSTWDDLNRIPLDSLDAQCTRVWMGLHLPSTCKTQVRIYDTASHPCRTLINRMMSSGYYNLYWDKRDDSGRFVPPGRYLYVVTPSCGETYKGTLTVHYKQWERNVSLHSEPGKTPIVTLTVDSAATRLSLFVYTWNDNVLDTICVDSVFSRGSHRVEWNPLKAVSKGLFWVHLHVGDFVTRGKLWR
jgi:hypothetical protein